jgi:hypothetical protein
MSNMHANDEKPIGTFRRLGEYGPVYQVVAVRNEGPSRVAEIHLPKSGEKTTLPLEQVLANPKAE